MSTTMRVPTPESREEKVFDAFVDLADSLVMNYVPIDFLYRLLDHSLPLTEADAAAVLLNYEGRLHLIASSSEHAEAVELFEVQGGQGPAGEAFDRGELITSQDPEETAERWPDFASAASDFHWSALIAVPLRLRDITIGSLIVFWPDDEGKKNGFDSLDEKTLRAFADVATIAVLQRQEVADVEATNQQLHIALASRVKIEQAKGIIAHASDVDMGEAFAILRQHARAKREKVTDVAVAVVAGDIDIETLAKD